ncbi:MAG TPA: ribosome maturation factor RimP [Candidatus Limiplasma sp.]|nr:ribosome maturation factor RimP [Candidatus Limiplasma sp.]HRX07928.1 ribosome maturation factor RimP [Candidatus Limiplasma sp.]
MKNSPGVQPVNTAREIAQKVADAQGFELVDVTLQKEADGLALCVYIDSAQGITLDDCERYHKAVQPLLSQIEYDYLEVSSPGADRPVKTQRDFEKHKGDTVEIRLFAKLDGVKQFTGALLDMDDDTVSITLPDGQAKSFQRKAVALIKPVIMMIDEEE